MIHVLQPGDSCSAGGGFNGFDPFSDDSGLDADEDGLTNRQEYDAGSSSNSSDTDGDGLSDFDEVITHGTSPVLSDTDNDGMKDDYELSNGFNPLDGDDCPSWICGAGKGWRLFNYIKKDEK
jgi:hypothetical protein